MFSVVWPFCAMAAFANNVIHIQNSFYKLVLLRRRPVPRKANSINQWEKMLFITLFLAIFVVVGLICVSTGELEFFISECMALERFNGKDFRYVWCIGVLYLASKSPRSLADLFCSLVLWLVWGPIFLALTFHRALLSRWYWSMQLSLSCTC